MGVVTVGAQALALALSVGAQALVTVGAQALALALSVGTHCYAKDRPLSLNSRRHVASSPYPSVRG